MPGIELDDSPRFAARERQVRRVAGVLMATFVVLAALGLFGFGPLSSTATGGPGYEVTYDRFGRNGAPFGIDLRSTGGGPLRVWIEAPLLEALELDQVTPAAASERLVGGGVLFTFADGQDPGSVRFAFTADTVGPARGRVGRSPDDAVGVSVFFYP
ncbi:MAG TPA: hypothetical protein VK875_09800 [Euzebyales bacterium]|nr:hypothetical protein [Euzebyales bacterium]